MKVFIIAEAGVNHNGSLDICKKLVDVSAKAGADAVKFQTFKAGKLVTANAEKARYQIENTGTRESQVEMLRRLELSTNAHKDLFAYCRQKNISFLSSRSICWSSAGLICSAMDAPSFAMFSIPW